VIPNTKSLNVLCKQLRIPESTPLQKICVNSDVVKIIHKSIIETGFKQKLHRIEIPSMITICHQEWTPDNGLLTAAMKLKRNFIIDKHRSDIDRMFKIIKTENKKIKIECNNI
jgi:long-chain acyl-CoA synthetase